MEQTYSTHYKKKARGVLYYPEAFCIKESASEDSDFLSIMRLGEKPVNYGEKAIYVHIPFCLSTCAFCCFKMNRYLYDDKKVEKFYRAILKEIQLYAQTPYIRNATFDALYFGGGTPTCLSEKQLVTIVGEIMRYFPLKDTAEITVEASPSCITREKLDAYYDTGVNRISYGIQTFDDGFSKMLELPQNPEKSKRVLEMTHEAGFKNIDIDLIYNLPGQTLDDWEHDLKEAVRLGVGHITTPRLLPASYTKLTKRMRQGEVPQIGSVTEEMKFFEMTKKLLCDAGYEMRTTLASFAFPGITWRLAEIRTEQDVVAIGPGAGGHVNDYRYVNTIDIDKYSKMINKGSFPVQKGLLENSPEEHMRGYIAKKMVLTDGVDKRQFHALFGRMPEDIFSEIIIPLSEKGLVSINDTHIRLTDAGLFWGGNISNEFISPKYADCRF